mgnify:FL=1
MLGERAQKVARETGALVYWIDATDSAALIETDKTTLSAVGALLE